MGSSSDSQMSVLEILAVGVPEPTALTTVPQFPPKG